MQRLSALEELGYRCKQLLYRVHWSVRPEHFVAVGTFAVAYELHLGNRAADAHARHAESNSDILINVLRGARNNMPAPSVYVELAMAVQALKNPATCCAQGKAKPRPPAVTQFDPDE